MKDRTVGFRIFNAFNITLMILLSITFLFPFINVLAKAFNDGADASRGGVWLWPRKFSTFNFEALLSQDDLFYASYISIARVLIGVLLSLFVTFGAGYALSIKGWRGRGAFQLIMLIPMYIGGGFIPYYLLLSSLGLINNFLVYVLPGAFSYFSAVMVRVYITSNIPSSLEESAKIDGANDFRILFRIILPLCAPIIATICLFRAVGLWNDWTTTLIYADKKSLHTLQYKLALILRENQAIQQMIQETIRKGQSIKDIPMPKTTPEALRSALMIIVTAPIIITYPLLQRYFIKGAVIGAVKD